MAKRKNFNEPEAVAQLTSLLASGPIDDESAADMWMEAEGIVDGYLDAVDSHSTDLPTAQALGQSCFRLLQLTGLIDKGENLDLVAEFLSPKNGLLMYSMAPRLRKLKADALVALETLAKEQQAPAPDTTGWSDDVPF